jgi:hypothetical protein
VLSTLAGLADDDQYHARLRETLLAFLQTGGSYKTTAEQLMLHKNTVQYRIRKANESLGRPVGEHRALADGQRRPGQGGPEAFQLGCAAGYPGLQVKMADRIR